MALDVAGVCDAAAGASDVPSLAVFLTVLFSAFISLNTLVASIAISRKSAESERLAGLA